MNVLHWCFTQKKGLKLIEPNTNLAEAYLKKSEEAIETMTEISNKGWKITTAYYAMYFSLYSILQRIGIKSEIHICTIRFAQSYLKDYFTDEELNFLEQAMEQRIENQYYTNPQINQEFYIQVVNIIPKFFVKCKSIICRITDQDIKNIRDIIKNNMKNNTRDSKNKS